MSRRKSNSSSNSARSNSDDLTDTITVQMTSMETLRWEFESLRMEDDEALHSLSEKLEEEYRVKNMLRAASLKFIQITSMIEEFSDLKSTTMEEQGMIIVILVNAIVGVVAQSATVDKDFRHFASDCNANKKEEKVHLVEKQDDVELALLMANACDLSVWYLDTGASNHMTGYKKNFAKLDETINGKVRFGDGAVLNICSCITILFQCKNGEHMILINIYYILKLKSNIIIIEQLDVYGEKTVIE
ncbi:hypothetical protein MANES_09G007750v8 [Manihot esculenta]|uniref:Uncharacterized protein n=1 Tax=Manihot esculenta TaxID=3983 RepID=A0ACB7H1D4_MANES|nr:hypothetical protein MANES_09G007750v8 [Manihot esculenta]